MGYDPAPIQPAGFDKPAPPMAFAAPPATSGLAVTSLLLGLASLCLSFLTALPGVICGIVALANISSSRGRLRGKGMAITGIVTSILGLTAVPVIGILIALLLPAVQAGREAGRQVASSNNLKQIGLALLNYHDTHMAFPPAGSEKSGMPLSWRVRILPYIEQQGLFQRFHMDEPWNSPHNLALLSQMPEVYKSPNYPGEDFKTVYLGVVGVDPEDRGRSPGAPGMVFPGQTTWDPARAHTCFHRGRSTVRMHSVLDGTANTIMVVEADADRAVEWTKPDDWELDLQNPRAGLGNLRRGRFLALFVDGSVQPIPTSDDENLRRLFVRDDGMVVVGY